MGRTVPGGLFTHAQGETTNFATLWRITRRDGTQHFFTDHDADISVDVDLTGGNNLKTYLAASGYSRSSIQHTATMSVDNLEVQGHLDPTFSQISEADIQSGKLDFAQVEMFTVNWSNPGQGVIKTRKGFLGEVSIRDATYFAELRGLVQILGQANIGEKYTPGCRADLGDDRCKVPTYPKLIARSTAIALGEFYRVVTLGMPVGDARDFEDRIYEVTTAGTTAASQPAYNTGVGVTTTDGTAVLTARHSWFRAVQVVNVIDSRRFVVSELTPNSGQTVSNRVLQTIGFPDDYFNGGLMHFETGNNAALTEEIDDFVADDGVTIEQEIRAYRAFPFVVQVGDRGFCIPGCDKSLLGSRGCRDGFDNVDNMRAEPYVPGNDQFLRGPDIT